MSRNEYDALLVGAGFSGIYQLKSFLDLGMSVKVIDAAGDIGGTWYWNRYPGAMSDTQSEIYRFSWDKEDLLEYPWPEHYIKQPDALKYLNHVVERHDLRKHMQFNTKLSSAKFDEDKHVWNVTTNTGDTIIARFLVTGLGLLSATNIPNYKGIDTFKGEMYHTGKFPKDWDFSKQRVGVIGSGSTGVQVITAIGQPGKTRSLTCFQRSPQYSVPSGDGPVSADYRKNINDNYDELWNQVRNSIVAFGFEESTIPAMSVSEEERQRIFQENWDMGNGFRFMFGTFCDITYDREANEAACNFIKGKIKETVKDQEKARKLLPDEIYARRPLCDGGYYEVFNNDNVDIVHLKETPIEEITSTGIKTSDGKQYDLDVIIWATGFDSVDGSYTRIGIRGRGGESLQDHWTKKEGPSSYLGLCVPNFPNLFMITGPMGPFTNIPPAIESQVEFITEFVKRQLQADEGAKGVAQGGSAAGKAAIEAKQDSEDRWMDHCYSLASGTLFTEPKSWIFGANIPGKKNALMFFFGGMKAYRDRLANEAAEKYSGFTFPKAAVAAA